MYFHIIIILLFIYPSIHPSMSLLVIILSSNNRKHLYVIGIYGTDIISL